jgi:hypothetical protein
MSYSRSKAGQHRVVAAWAASKRIAGFQISELDDIIGEHGVDFVEYGLD